MAIQSSETTTDGARDRADRREALAVVALQALAIGWVARRLPAHWGMPLDDAWIHQVVARNLVERHHLGFAPGVKSSGSTSVLWPVVVAGAHLFALDPVAYCLVINTLALLGFSLAMIALARADGMDRPRRLVFAALPALSGNFVWFGTSGMETVLFCALSAWTILLWFDRRSGHERATAAGAGAMLGLLAMTRPEGAALGLVLAVSARSAGRGIRETALTAVIGGTGAAIPAALNVVIGGSPLPTTLAGRRWLHGFDTEAWPVRIGGFLCSWAEHLGTFTLGPARRLVPLFALFALGGLAVVYRNRHRRAAVLCLWAVLHAALYLVVLPNPGHGGRYQPLTVALFLPLAALGMMEGAQRLLASRRASWRVVAQGGLLGTVLVLAVGSLERWSTLLALGVDHIEGTHHKVGLWIRDHLSEEIVVAAFDIGAMGYTSHHAVLDLGGLVDPAYVPYLRGGRVPDYLAAHRARYVVLPVGYGESAADHELGRLLGLLDNPRVVLRPVFEVESPASLWRPGFDATGHALPRQVLYALGPEPEASTQPRPDAPDVPR
jgi:hypothetical protein